MKNWFKSLHKRSLQLANTKWGTWLLFICAFTDASFFPLPTTSFFLVITFLNTKKTFNYTLFVILGTLAGALAGYLFGHFAWLKPNGEFTGLVQFLFNNIPGFSTDFYERVHILYAKYGFWILCSAAATPLPYGILSISSGAFNLNIIIFFFATLISQAIKFSFLALLILKFGQKVKRLMELKWKPVAIIAMVSIAIAIIVINSN